MAPSSPENSEVPDAPDSEQLDIERYSEDLDYDHPEP
jgi:hypothetical protein